LTKFIHNSDLRKIRLSPELRNVPSSVMSATVCTITMRAGETSGEGQILQPPNIPLMVLTDCLCHVELVRFGG